MTLAKNTAFFCLEGLDGCGKSTQVQLLTKKLESEGYTVINVREPGGTTLGEKVREILLDPSLKPCDMSELLLFNASRAQLLHDVVRPALEKENTIVLADRFAGSTLAYQGYARGGNLEQIQKVLDVAVGDLWPHQTWLLDISLEESRRRRGIRGTEDRLEMEGEVFRDKVRAGYLELSEKFSWKKVSAEAETKEICGIIFNDMVLYLRK
jgi:dTMP kinase